MIGSRQPRPLPPGVWLRPPLRPFTGGNEDLEVHTSCQLPGDSSVVSRVVFSACPLPWQVQGWRVLASTGHQTLEKPLSLPGLSFHTCDWEVVLSSCVQDLGRWHTRWKGAHQPLGSLDPCPHLFISCTGEETGPCLPAGESGIKCHL